MTLKVAESKNKFFHLQKYMKNKDRYEYDFYKQDDYYIICAGFEKMYQ